MSPRRALTGVLLLALCADPALALEKLSAGARRIEDRPPSWNAGATCSIVYYNICDGWVSGWSPWAAGERLGTFFDTCCPDQANLLNSSWWWVFSGNAAGYGFTGTVDVFAGDSLGCPSGPAIASQPWLPQADWNLLDWGGVTVPDRFVVTYTHPPSVLPNPVVHGSDNPQNPQGPPACGTCYPTTRETHSFVYGAGCSKFALNPGGPCDVEWLLDCQLGCPSPVQRSGWGAIKELYR